MAEGMRFYNDDGSVYMDLTTYCGAFLGSFSTNGASSGSLSVPALVGKRLLAFCPQSNLQGQGSGGPVVTLNSSTGLISWAITGTSSGGSSNFTVFYGGY